MRARCQYPWNVLHLVVYFKHPICVKVYNGKVVLAGHSLVDVLWWQNRRSRPCGLADMYDRYH